MNLNDEKNDVSDLDDTLDILDMLIDAFSGNPFALARFGKYAIDKSYTAIQQIPYKQMQMYLEGVKRVEDDLGKACEFSNKLFSNPKTKEDNAMRVYKLVISTDTSRKMKYLINATRSMLLGLIDVEMMFRLFSAIAETLQEDLDYLSTIVQIDKPIKGSIRVHALARVGLMISAGIDAQADVEEQEYYISSLGLILDEFALSLEDENRQAWYKTHSRAARQFESPMALSDEEIKKMLSSTFEEQKQEMLDAITPAWNRLPDNRMLIAETLSQNPRALALLVCLTKYEGTLNVSRDICHSNPYVCIGEFELPSNDDAEESAHWVGAVELLNEFGFIGKNGSSDFYKLTSDGWTNAELYLASNEFTDDELHNPNELLASIFDEKGNEV